jgi:hypothetical protein
VVSYRDSVAYWFERDVDFRTYLYVPEVDPTTKAIHHEKADHCHLLKRIANHTREGRYSRLELLGFDKAVEDPNTGLTYEALIGKRKQSVVDAEKLLSHRVSRFLQEANSYHVAAKFVQTIARWHESSDGTEVMSIQLRDAELPPG